MTEDERERLGRMFYELVGDVPDPGLDYRVGFDHEADYLREDYVAAAETFAAEVRRQERAKVAALADAILRALAGVRIEPDEAVVVHDPAAFNAGMIGLCNALADLEETP